MPLVFSTSPGQSGGSISQASYQPVSAPTPAPRQYVDTSSLAGIAQASGGGTAEVIQRAVADQQRAEQAQALMNNIANIIPPTTPQAQPFSQPISSLTTPVSDDVLNQMSTSQMEQLADLHFLATMRDPNLLPPQKPISAQERDLAVGLVQAGIMRNRPTTTAEAVLSAFSPVPVAGANRLMGGRMYDLIEAGGQPVFRNGRLMGVLHEGLLGGTVYTGQQFSGYEGPNASLVRPPEEEERDDRPSVVLPQDDEETGAKKCPEGYIFDEDLKACRVDAPVPNLPTSVASTNNYEFYEQPYESLGLLNTGRYRYGEPLVYG